MEAESDDTDLWGTPVGDIQENIAVSDGKITGNLKYLSSGTLVNDWGAGNFLSLKFADPDDVATSIKVGLDPSASGMPLQELDEDMNCVYKVSDKDAQVFKVQISDGTRTVTRVYDLSGLEVASDPLGTGGLEIGDGHIDVIPG